MRVEEWIEWIGELTFWSQTMKLRIVEKYVGLHKIIPHPLLFIGTIKILKSFFPAFIPVVDWWGEMQPPGSAVNNIKRF